MKRRESDLEKKINFYTHAFGVLLSLIGMFFLLEKSLSANSEVKILLSIIYCFSLVFMFTASSIYHYYDLTSFSEIFQKIDHISIYLLIAGSYTPPLILKLSHSLGYYMLIVIWSLAIFGIIQKLFYFKSFSRFSLFVYLLMGWMIIIDFNAVLDSFSDYSLVMMISGGLSYTIGAVFYSLENLKYNHSVWHVFVLIGAFCHFLLMNSII